MAETNDKKIIRVEASKMGYTLWNNPRGVAYQGKRIRDQNREVTLANYRVIEFGVGGDGGSDLVGFKPLVITQDMVGLTVAVFTVLECKRAKGRSVVRDDQEKYLHFVRDNGGIAAVVKTPEDIPRLAPVETRRHWRVGAKVRYIGKSNYLDKTKVYTIAGINSIPNKKIEHMFDTNEPYVHETHISVMHGGFEVSDHAKNFTSANPND